MQSCWLNQARVEQLPRVLLGPRKVMYGRCMVPSPNSTVDARAQASPAPDFTYSTSTSTRSLCWSKHKGIIIFPVPLPPPPPRSTPQQVVTTVTASRGYLLRKGSLRSQFALSWASLGLYPPQYLTILKTCSCWFNVFHRAPRHGRSGLEVQ